MKILLINDYGSPNGGAEIATLLLRTGLRDRGHDALLLSSSARPSGGASAADIECFGTIGRSRALLQSANLSARRTVQRTLDDFRPDVVHVGIFLTQLSPLILPALRGFPAVYHAHWLRAICPTGFKLLPDGATCGERAGLVCYRSGCLPLRDWLPLMAQMQLLRRWRDTFNVVVANSDATRLALEAEGFNDVTVIRNGVSPGARRPPLTGGPIALFCGRLTAQKGVEVLLNAWRTVVQRIPDARLLIAGDGPERERLEGDAPPGVSFCGRLAHDEIDRIAASAWIQVVPSIGFEPFGLVAAEAMMRGTAVVCSRVGGLPEVVQDEITGKLVPPGDSEGLAATMIAMLLDRELCEAMGERGRSVANERFAEHLYVDRFIECYRSLLAEPCAGR
jgi:glycosyltransferase involved in cell wall biosynthesis